MFGLLKNMIVYAFTSIFGQPTSHVQIVEPVVTPTVPVVSSYNLRERAPVNYREYEEDDD
jgi:hypothetical protein